VYKAELRGSGVQVAVKVQRPSALATISKGVRACCIRQLTASLVERSRGT